MTDLSQDDSTFSSSSLLPQDLCSQLLPNEASNLPNNSHGDENRPSARGVRCGYKQTNKQTSKGDNGYSAKSEHFLCPVCSNEYKAPSELKGHFKSHVPPRQDFNCWKVSCPFRTQDRKHFQLHLRKEHCLTPVTCAHRTCRWLFPNSEEMNLHFRYHFPFHCSQCDFVSSNTKLFSQHKKEHNAEKDNCLGGGTTQPLQVPTTQPRQDIPHDSLKPNKKAEYASLSPQQTMKRAKTTTKNGISKENPMCVTDGDSSTFTAFKNNATKVKNSHTVKNKSKAFKGDVENGKEHLFKTHMCPECKRCFKKRTHLADHLHLHFPDPNLQCPNCHKFFTSSSKLKIHMMREAGEKTHRCPLCNYSSVEKNALNRHMASIHEGVSNFYSDTYSCPVCQETFNLSQALKDHMKGHKSDPQLHLCFEQDCNQAMSDRKEFLRHLKESHGIQAVECRYHACSLLFKSREEMEQHRKNHYAFHCQECDFVCSNKHTFRKHKKCGHPGKEELSCPFCSFKSFNPVEYNDHVGKMHANEKIHRCGDCDFATAHKRVLIRHTLLHTGEKPHKCTQCDFMCRDISYLSKHMLTHSSDKNYMCTECGYITKWKHYLNVHMRKHSGDLRYHCNQCAYRCHRADQLSSHKLRHQGKNLICEVCGFGCKRKYELQKHMQSKHSQTCQIPMYQCRYCNYQTKYKQALHNHENCKHTKHREFHCVLCPYRTFSNTSLFFHKRKAHGYTPGDKDWLARYARMKQDISQSDLLFLYTSSSTKSPEKPVPSGAEQNSCLDPLMLSSKVDSSLNVQEAGCLQVADMTEPSGDNNISVTDESLLATITLEPVETCSIEIEDYPVQIQLSETAEEALGTCEDSLHTREELLCFNESLEVENNINCGQVYDEETDPNLEDNNKMNDDSSETRAKFNQEPLLCDLNDKCADIPVHVGANLDLQHNGIPLEVDESWAHVVKDGVQLTIICESTELADDSTAEEENSATFQGNVEEISRPESMLRTLRKQDREQAETLVLEGRVQMLVVQSSTPVYRCEKCPYITRKEGCMLQHSKSGCHTRKSSLVCEECGASFKQQRGLNTHIIKKCPVMLKRKKSSAQAASSTEATIPETGLEAPASDQGIMEESQASLTSEIHVEHVLSSCQDLVLEDFKGSINEKNNVLEKVENQIIEFSSASENLATDPLMSSGYQDSKKYKFEHGKFRCMFCSFVCSRECTIICHVRDNCRELRGTSNEAALRRHLQQNHGLMEVTERSVSSMDDESQNTEEDDDHKKESVYKISSDPCNDSRISCPSCPFTCSQNRAMRTHVKKGCLKPGELQCPLCSFRCMSAAALKRHKVLHQKYSRNQAQLKCKQCDFTCKQPRCMNQHVNIHHEGVKPHRCRYCDFSTTRRYRLDAHESLHTGVGRISCDSCIRTFGTNSKLRLHQRRVHEKKPTHFCSLCDYSGYSQNDIARHMGSCHNGELAFPCDVCQASFSSEAALKQHTIRKHQEKATQQCLQCQFSCHSLATLRCHLQKHHLQLDCSICKQTFCHRKDLEEHRKSHFAHHCHLCQYAAKDRQQLVHHYIEEHETLALPGSEQELGLLCCPFCSFSCRHQLVYDHHVKGHGGIRVYKCSDCDYTTKNKQKITWHSRIHTGEKPYKCHLCSYACADPSRLKYHMRIHKDEKKYLCPECGYKCKWVNQLKYHMTKHTGLKPYQCEECDYCTNRADALRVHRETRHREVRSFICEQCGKAFKTRFLLKTHMRKHSEEKPYVCNLCQSSFRWPAGLRHHYLTHTNQHPFFCQYCTYRAKQKFQVVKHLQKHHPDQPDITKGIGKDPSMPSVQTCDSAEAKANQPLDCEGDSLSGMNLQ
ncbi:zinc finger protein 142 isoform X2 [Xenopus laevis]|uniref:Zinc finger protein 142 n=1 Tax=Xenopus laevis TaxID=8355 RepID=A0A8J1LUL2_XENLA|nr:zinc finger protein 142 isoform X2 [Xenopus laevis]